MITRRTFVSTLAAAAAASLPRTALAGPAGWAVQPPAGRRGIKLGFNHFSLRGFGWKAGALIDYAATLGIDALLLSELNVFEQRDEAHLKGLKAKADAAGLALYVGMGSICPSSGTFDAKAGTAVDQVRDAIRIARTLGSPVLRCFLGRFDDRLKQGGIEGHIRNTVEVCKSVRGVRRRERHQARGRESRRRHAGLGACGAGRSGRPRLRRCEPRSGQCRVDHRRSRREPRNAGLVCGLHQHPRLGPLENARGRDGAVDGHGRGRRRFQAMGRIFASRTKGVPVFIETISGLARPFPVLTPEFWKPWPKARAQDLARWLAIADRGKPRNAVQPARGRARTPRRGTGLSEGGARKEPGLLQEIAGFGTAIVNHADVLHAQIACVPARARPQQRSGVVQGAQGRIRRASAPAAAVAARALRGRHAELRARARLLTERVDVPAVSAIRGSARTSRRSRRTLRRSSPGAASQAFRRRRLLSDRWAGGVDRRRSVSSRAAAVCSTCASTSPATTRGSGPSSNRRRSRRRSGRSPETR